MKTLLIVEDDSHLSRGITLSFEKEGYGVLCAETVSEGAAFFRENAVDLVILDLNLPDGNGVDFCKKLRETSAVPVIMLTARDLEADELAGLNAGADDYITKPFSVSVLRARVENILRRTSGNATIRCGGFRLDTTLFKLYRENEEIPVSTTEFRILRLLMGNAGKIQPKEQITATLWENQEGFIDDNALTVNISRLRGKIEENPRKPTIIKTIHGIGYVWVTA